MNKKWHLWLRLGIVSIFLGTLLAVLQSVFGEGEIIDFDDIELPKLALRILIFVTGCFLVLSLLVPISNWFPRFGRWLFNWFSIKGGMIAFAVLAVLAALIYVEEDWRGQRAWEKYKHELEAKGEKLDFASFIPPQVPDDQNFALTPIVASCYSGILDKNGHRIEPPNTNVVNHLDMELYRTNVWFNRDLQLSTWQKGRPINLEAWQQYYRKRFETNEVRKETPLPSGTIVLKQNGTNDAIETIVWTFPTDEFPVSKRPQSPAADVLLALSKYDSAIEELRQASRLPYSRFPANYDEPDPTEIRCGGSFKSVISVLDLRAVAELSDGQNEKTLDDIKLMLYLINSINDKPSLGRQIYARIPLVNSSIQPIWEGLSEHRWSDSQLATIEQELARFDFLSDYCHAIRCERAEELKTIDFLCDVRFTNYVTCIFGCHTNWTATIVYRALPRGWYCANKIIISCICQGKLPTKDEIRRHVLSPSLIWRSSIAYGREAYRQFRPYSYFLRTYPNFVQMLCPFLGEGPAKKFAFAQASVDMARIACALERYRLKHGEYPDKLDALTPQFIEKLPNDIINGQPLHYKRDTNGQFILYSVGWDEKDDGGESGWVDDYEKDDWVWQYPVK